MEMDANFTRGPIEKERKLFWSNARFRLKSGSLEWDNHFANIWVAEQCHFQPVKAQNSADSL
jgi:hypothetical protein